MGSNRHYVPRHAARYSQTHDFGMTLPGAPKPKHLRTGLMSGFKPMGPNR